MRFHPFHTLGSKKNIIVDGAARENSVLVLSHWPASPTPDAWLRDTSAEIVLDYIENETMPEGVEFVSNNHYDEDGLLGICALLDPEFALAHRQRFVDAAAAGDFNRYEDRDAARAIFTLSRLVEDVPANSDYAEHTAALYETLIPKVHDLIADIGRFEETWRDEDRYLDQCEQWLDAGVVGIEEDDTHDLAVVRIPETLPAEPFHEFIPGAAVPLHSMAMYRRTRKARILIQQGQRYWFRYRYETWVKFVSERHPLRVDLAPLADDLTAREGAGAVWAYDGSSNITPVLSPRDGHSSSLPLETVLECLRRVFDTGSVDWDPYTVSESGH